jgi:hypothetical protein
MKLSTSFLAKNGHPSNHRFKAIALLRAYFDETGTHTASKAVMVCGIVAPMDIWDEFDMAWRKQLAVEKVSYFHAVECEHGENEFQPLSRGLRDSLTWGLADVIGQRHIHIINSGVHRASWADRKYRNVKAVFESPYHLCFAHCLQQLSDWSKNHANGELIALVFSEQSEYRNHAEKIFKAYMSSKMAGEKLVSLQFAPMRQFPGLQAADLVCYETYQNFLAGFKKKEDVKRVGMKRLLEGNSKFISSPFAAQAWGKLLSRYRARRGFRLPS